MISIISNILGSPSIIEKGLELIDDAWETDAEKVQGKADAKINLLKAYAPFKLAQRYLALMFGATYLLSFFLVLGMTLAGHEVEDVFKVLEQFKVGWIMTTIILFYFGGGLVDSIGKAKK
tara:strand:- start:119 stop:478 length:360 start_codon:yes stop_codon:yes gene_type:complete